MSEEIEKKEIGQPSDANATSRSSDSQPKRIRDSEFFSKDLLGEVKRDRLLRNLTFESRTAQSLYKLTYERIDGYLYRPKENATLIMARDLNNEMDKLIGNRLDELENYVSKRAKMVLKLYEAATAIETYEFENQNAFAVKAGFSSGYANRYLSILESIDDVCQKAGYLEKIGQFDVRQESTVTSELYRKTVEISRIIIRFIIRTIRAIRRDLKERNTEATVSVA